MSSHTKQKISFDHRNTPLTPAVPVGITSYTEKIRAIGDMKTGAYETHEHILRLPLDGSMLAEVEHVAQRYYNSGLRYVFVVGIGGSNLGARAVYDALRGTMDAGNDEFPKLIFLDTISPRAISDVEHLLETKIGYLEEVLVVYVSKSGGTTECLANFEFLYDMLVRRFKHQCADESVRSRLVVITDHGSKLWKKAEQVGDIGMLAIPEKVGGRFSVFSPAGLLPLALVGVDVAKFIEGGRDCLHTCLREDDHALRMAEALYRSMHHGTTMINFFFFNPELESLGKWARQLYAESLGKEKDRSGHTVHAGITPIVSMGTVDLHSMVQLYLAGPRDKFTLFLHIPERSHALVPTKGLFTDLVSGVGGCSPDAILTAIYEGVKTAYAMHKLPHGEVTLPALSPYALGMFMEWQMLTVMYLGELMHVNVFDQPNVEDYKKITREILATKKAKDR